MQQIEHVFSRPAQSGVLAALRAAFPCTIPVLTGYFVLGLGYGGTLCYVLLVQLVFA